MLFDLVLIVAHETGADAVAKNFARALRDGVRSASRTVKAQLRAQVEAAGFSGNQRRITDSWRVREYPAKDANGVSLGHAALIYSAAPDIISAFDQGVTVHAKGGTYLCYPTKQNRKGTGLLITPAGMITAGQRAFVLPARDGTKLWCLRAPGRGQRAFTPMFVLRKEVGFRKRLDIAAVRAAAPNILKHAIETELP
jgi:hypothetical protein